MLSQNSRWGGITLTLSAAVLVASAGCSGDNGVPSGSYEDADLSTAEQGTFSHGHGHGHHGHGHHGHDRDHRGPRFCGGHADWQCADDDVCLPFLARGCPGPRRIGLCVPPPRHCPPITSPVCGCDGNTYSNTCEAVKAGTSVEHRGECAESGQPMCGGEAGESCAGMATCEDDMSDNCDRSQDPTCSGICTCKLVEKCSPREVWDMDPAVCGCIPAPPDACAGVECPNPTREQCVAHDDGTTSCEEIGEK